MGSDRRRAASSAPFRPLLLLTALAAALLAGCAAPGAPPVRVECALGPVRAPTRLEARWLADRLVELRPQVAALLGDARRDTPELWLVESMDDDAAVARLGDHFSGATIKQDDVPVRIVLRRDEDRERLSTALAHELTHALLGPSWGALPAALEEGLCDHVSATLVPESGRGATRLLWGVLYARDLRLAVHGARFSARVEGGSRVTTKTTIHGEVRFGRDDDGGDDLPALDALLAIETSDELYGRFASPDALARAYGAAYTLTRRIVARGGLQALRALCERARAEGLRTIPPAWLLRAGAAQSARALSHAALDELESDGLLARALDGHYRELGEHLLGFPDEPELADLDFEGFLALGLSFELPGGERIALRELPRLRAFLAERWPVGRD